MGLGACGSGSPPSITGGQITAGKVGGQGVWIAAPSRSVRGVVIYVHGYVANQTALTAAHRKDLTEALVGAGYVVASDNAHGDAWGDPASQADYVALGLRLIARYHPSKLFVLSESMGGLAGLMLVGRHELPGITGWAGILPVVNLRDAAHRKEFAASIKRAYGSTSLETGDPSQLPASTFAGIPMRVYWSPGDTLVPPAAQELPFLASVQHSARVTTVQCHGEHGDPSCYEGPNLVAWIDSL